MYLLTILLTILLLTIIAAVTFAFVILLRNNAALKKELDRPSSIGISYKTENEDVKKIMNRLSTVMLDIQTSACPSIKKLADANKDKLLNNISKDANGKPIKCSDIRKKYDEYTTKYGKDMSRGAESSVSKDQLEKLQKDFKALSEAILEAVCVNDEIDVKKADKLFTDVINAICYL